MFKKIVNITLALFALTLTGVVQAQDDYPTLNDGDNFEKCILDGGKSETNGKIISCCVPVDAFADKCTSCVKGTSACRTTYPSKLKEIPPTPEPPSLRDQIKQPQSTTSEPAKAVDSGKAPTRYQQIKVPTKDNQTMSK